MAIVEEKRRFRRAVGDSAYLYGVCAGFAYYIGLPAYLVRLIAAFLFVGMFPISLGIYYGLWLTTPRWDIEPDDFVDVISGRGKGSML